MLHCLHRVEAEIQEGLLELSLVADDGGGGMHVSSYGC